MADTPVWRDPRFARYFRGARGLVWRYRLWGTWPLDGTHWLILVASREKQSP